MKRPRHTKSARAATTPLRLYLFVVMAAPPEGKSASPVLLTFVTGPDPEGAASKALTELQKRGWRGAEIQGAKELPLDPAAEPDQHARDAIIRALATGFDLIAYG